MIDFTKFWKSYFNGEIKLPRLFELYVNDKFVMIGTIEQIKAYTKKLNNKQQQLFEIK